MTAGGAEATRAMRNQESLEKKPLGPAPSSRRQRRRLRRKLPPEAAVKGQLRMRSPSGAFVMVGISVVLVGMTIAVVGYWPHWGSHTAGTRAGLGNSSSTGDIKKEVKNPAPTASEKLKLIGPVIMGVGLFIFICANTMLYENRDMETRLLMQKGLCTTTLGLPQGVSLEDPYCQRRTSVPLLTTNAECVEGCYEVDLSSGGFQSHSSPGNKWADCYGPNRLQTTAQLLHHKGVSPSISLLSVRSDSGNSMEGNLNLSFTPGTESKIPSAVNAPALPVIKVNNCLLKKPSRSWGAGDNRDDSLAEAPHEALQLSWTHPPRGSHISPRGDDLQGGRVVVNIDSGVLSDTAVETLLTQEGRETEFSSDMQLQNPNHSKSLDLGRPGVLLVAPSKDQKNRSWPRLDHISFVSYAKLESTGESSDWLLEQTDEQGRDEPAMSTQEAEAELGSRV